MGIREGRGGGAGKGGGGRGGDTDRLGDKDSRLGRERATKMRGKEDREGTGAEGRRKSKIMSERPGWQLSRITGGRVRGVTYLSASVCCPQVQ